MSKIVKIFCIVVVCPIIFCACNTKERKAEKLIRSELSRTLYDYDSYKPIETKVEVAKRNMYNDTACWRLGQELANAIDYMEGFFDETTDAMEHMTDWGKPSYYSSSYSDRQYYKWKKKFGDAILATIATKSVCWSIARELKDSINAIDTTEVVGWEVSHSFRCKTKGGSSDIGHYRYVISHDFKEVYICDKNDDDDDVVRGVLLGVQTGKFETMLDGFTTTLSDLAKTAVSH